MQGMNGLDDETFHETQSRAIAGAVDILRTLHPMQALPRKDHAGNVRHGFGRLIERRPQSEEVAIAALHADVKAASEVLRLRVLTLLTLRPEAEHKLKYLYAIGDLMDAEKLRDWDELWSAMGRGDWDEVEIELVQSHWGHFTGQDKDKIRSVIRLIREIGR